MSSIEKTARKSRFSNN